MFDRIYFLLMLCSLFIACKDGPNESTLTEVGDGASGSVSLEAILQNDKIKIGKIKKKELENSISCTGQIKVPPAAISSVHSKVNGQVSFLKYHEGDFVQKGTLLTRIGNPQLIEKQRILLETKAELSHASKDYQRKKILRDNQATPERSYDESYSRFQILSSKYKGLKIELEAMGINVVKLENENYFQKTIPVTADQSGYINKVLVNQGQMITPETQLMEIVNINKVRLELNVMSQHIGTIKEDQRVKFTVPNHEETFNAEIQNINPMINHDQSTLQVWCSIDHPEKTIFVGGLFVNANILTTPVLSEGLPLSAVVKEGEEYFAFRIIDNNLKKTLLNNAVPAGDFIIFDGQKDGDWITDGAYYVEE